MNKKRDRGAILFISILLHSLLALLPWQEPQPEKPRPVAVPPTSASTNSPVSRISVVDASQLPTLPASESQPTSARPPAPAAPLPAAVDPPADPTPDVPIPETSNRSTNEPVSEAASSSVPPTTPSAGPSTPHSATPADEAQIAADWENLVGYFEGQDKGFGFELSEIFDLFGEPGPANRFLDENNEPKFDVSSFYHFPEQTPEQVFQDVILPELNSNTGFDPQLQENFSTGLAYQISQGEMLRYLIIVKLREDEGSVLMLSESLPGLES